MTIKKTTVTNARLINALKKATNKSLETKTDNNTIKTNLEVSECDLIEGEITRWYKGIDKAYILINNVEVEAFFNYPALNQDLIITIVPDGNEKTDETGSYIIPSNPMLCNVLKYKHHSSDTFKYCILGFKRGDSTKTGFTGEILLQAGNNQININKQFININAPLLIINGVKYDQQESQP